ncbi:MAG: TetR/AcrR family transcriptional regulator [Chloroflexi bacterium]|nr:TetR/AcrR family transcriptional regulator [Chloroflexota bacterium]
MVRKPSPEKRVQFQDAALRLFVAHGVQQTSTAAIAAEAGTAAGTLFLYFPTKQDLINQLTLKIGREQSEYVNSLLQPSQSARESFLAIWSGSLQWFQDNRDAYKLFQQVRTTNLVDEETVRESETYLAYFFEAIQKGIAEGCLKKVPLELIGEMLYHGIVAVMDLIDRQSDHARQEEYIQSGFAIFWDGIKK